MAELKTKKNKSSVTYFLKTIENKKRKEDSMSVLELMKKVTGEKPAMWGTSIIGFGDYHYKYESGREGDFFKVGFSPRKLALVIYIMPGFKKYEDLMNKLGKYKTGNSCLYINKLEDVDMKVLQQLIKEAYAYMGKKYK